MAGLGLDDAAASWFAAVVMRPGRVEAGLADTNVRVPRKARQQSDGDDGAVLAPSAGIRAIVCADPFTIWTTEWGCLWALSVVKCESGFNANAYNPAGPFRGWWQVLNGSYDPYLNTVEAHIQYWEWQGPDAWRTVSPWPRCPTNAPGLPVLE